MSFEPLQNDTVTNRFQALYAAPTSWIRPSRIQQSTARVFGRAARAVEEHKAQIPRSLQAPQEGAKFSERLDVLADWEGVVEELSEGNFTARLLDRRRKSKVDTELATIPLAEVQADDLPLVQSGAIFYLTIYRTTSRTGQSRRTTSLYFRRLPSWTRGMLASAEGRAQRWKKSFGVGNDSATAG